MNDPRTPKRRAMPPDWTPESDPAADRLRQLLRQSDLPTTPKPALFAAVHQDVRRRLLADGTLKATTPEPGFFAWLRQLAFGGGAGGQLVRLGAAVALAFYVGREVTPTANLTATKSPEVAAAQPTMPSAPIGTGPAPQIAVSGSGTIAKSTRPDHWDRPGNWATTASPEKGWMYGDAAPPAGNDTAAENILTALDRIQLLKFYAVVDRNDRSLSEVRRIEQSVLHLAPSDVRDGLLERYRRGEEALAGRRYGDAYTAFEEISRTSGLPAMRFVASFQRGTIAFDSLKDFAAALDAFETCQRDAAGLMIGDSYRTWLADRVQLLRECSADGWRSLRALREADESRDPEIAAGLLREAYLQTTSPRVAADTASRLTALALSANATAAAEPLAVSTILRSRINAFPRTADRSRILLCLGDLESDALDNPRQAVEDYRGALQMKPDATTDLLIRSRLAALTARIAAAGSGQVPP